MTSKDPIWTLMAVERHSTKFCTNNVKVLVFGSDYDRFLFLNKMISSSSNMGLGYRTQVEQNKLFWYLSSIVLSLDSIFLVPLSLCDCLRNGCLLGL